MLFAFDRIRLFRIALLEVLRRLGGLAQRCDREIQRVVRPALGLMHLSWKVLFPVGLDVSWLGDVLLENLLERVWALVSGERRSAWNVAGCIALEARAHVYVIGDQLGVHYFVDLDFLDVEHIAVRVT